MSRLTDLTRKLIEESFLELLQTNHVSKISVRMICEKAELSRSTFYRYYLDTYDVLDSIEKQFISSLADYARGRVFGDITAEATTEIVYFFVSNRKIHMLLSHNSPTYIKHIHDMIMKVFEDTYSKDGKKMSDGQKIVVEYNIGGTLSAIEYVLSNNEIYSPKDVLSKIVLPFRENYELYIKRVNK